MSELVFSNPFTGDHLRLVSNPMRAWRRENIEYSSKQLKKEKTALCITLQVLCGNHRYNWLWEWRKQR